MFSLLQSFKMGFIYNSCYCSVCAKEFVDANALSDHERQVHKEENLYCKICGKLETNSYTLYGHMQNHETRLCKVCNSVTVNFSNFSNFSGNEVFFPMLFNQLKNGFLWNSNFWKIIFYAFQILKRKFLCFSPTWKSYFMVFSLHFRVLNLYFLGFF